MPEVFYIILTTRTVASLIMITSFSLNDPLSVVVTPSTLLHTFPVLFSSIVYFPMQ